VERHLGRYLAPLVSGMVALSLAAAVWMASLSDDQIIRYRVTLLLLFFSISSASSLIFSAKARLEGNFYGLALTIGGPATLWIVALLLFSYVYPEDKIRSAGFDDALRLQRAALTRGRWVSYPVWKRDHDSFLKVLGTGSEAQQKLLWYAYENPREHKIESPTISTVFVYLKGKKALKFQRIYGDLQERKIRLRFKATASTSWGKASSLLLASTDVDSGRVEESHVSLEGNPKESVEIETSRVDALNVAFYDNDDPGEGDYTVVDLKRYANDGRGSIYLGILSYDREIQNATVSRIMPLRLTEDGDLPIALRLERMDGGDPDRLKAELMPWLKLLDARDAHGNGVTAEAASLLEKLSAELAAATGCRRGSCFQLIFEKPIAARSVSLSRAEYAAMLLFRWR
jgi:hypothetical protein